MPHQACMHQCALLTGHASWAGAPCSSSRTDHAMPQGGHSIDETLHWACDCQEVSGPVQLLPVTSAAPPEMPRRGGGAVPGMPTCSAHSPGGKLVAAVRPRHQTAARSCARAASSSLSNLPRSTTTCRRQTRLSPVKPRTSTLVAPSSRVYHDAPQTRHPALKGAPLGRLCTVRPSSMHAQSMLRRWTSCCALSNMTSGSSSTCEFHLLLPAYRTPWKRDDGGMCAPPPACAHHLLSRTSRRFQATPWQLVNVQSHAEEEACQDRGLVSPARQSWPGALLPGSAPPRPPARPSLPSPVIESYMGCQGRQCRA